MKMASYFLYLQQEQVCKKNFVVIHPLIVEELEVAVTIFHGYLCYFSC